MADVQQVATRRVGRHFPAIGPANQQRRNRNRRRRRVRGAAEQRQAIRPGPSGSSSAVLSMVAITRCRPAFTGTRTCSASSPS